MKKTTTGENIWLVVTIAYGLLVAFGPDSDAFTVWGAMVVGFGWVFVGGRRVRNQGANH